MRFAVLLHGVGFAVGAVSVYPSADLSDTGDVRELSIVNTANPHAAVATLSREPVRRQLIRQLRFFMVLSSLRHPFAVSSALPAHFNRCADDLRHSRISNLLSTRFGPVTYMQSHSLESASLSEIYSNVI